MPRPRKLPVTATPQIERAAPNPGACVGAEGVSPNDLAAALSKLIQGSEPANRAEAFLKVRWLRLTRDQQKALAAKWDLPTEQKADERLALQAIQELGNISLPAVALQVEPEPV